MAIGPDVDGRDFQRRRGGRRAGAAARQFGRRRVDSRGPARHIRLGPAPGPRIVAPGLYGSAETEPKCQWPPTTSTI